MPEPSEEELHAAVERWGATVGERLLRPLAPIYKEGHRHPEQFGTGILIRVEDLIFLVSAGHVADQVRGGAHYFGAGGRLLPLPSLRLSSPVESSRSRDEDPVDLGYWVLDPHTASFLTSADTLTLATLDPARVPSEVESAQFVLNGYPRTRQPRRLDSDEYVAKPFSFLTDEANDREYAAIDLPTDQNILVAFDKDDVFRAGSRVDGPDLFGVSGGAIWRLSGPLASSQNPRLAGVATTWRRSKPKVVIGTRIHVWIHAAAKEFPVQFRAAVDRMRARGAG
jgi:hypothetical protein